MRIERMVDVDEILRAIARGDVAAVADASTSEVNARDAFGRVPLVQAVLADGDAPAMVEALLGRGADPNVVEPGEEWTPLHLAARDQKLAKARALLAAGARVDAFDAFGNTPLWRSVMASDAEPAVISLLLEHGADPGRKNRSGIAPVDLARQTHRDELLRKFQAAGTS
jgi:uncharacterized protein